MNNFLIITFKILLAGLAGYFLYLAYTNFIIVEIQGATIFLLMAGMAIFANITIKRR